MSKYDSDISTHKHTNLKFLWFLYGVFILYGTLIPFNLCLNIACIKSNMSAISWLPFIDADGTRASIPDIVQNILFFIPFGFLGYFSCSNSNKLKRAVQVTFYGAILSLFVELCQLFTLDRTTSVTDLVTNTTGTLIGAFVASTVTLFMKQRLTDQRDHRKQAQWATFILLVAFVFIVLAELQPFDFTLDVGQVGSRIKALINNPVHFHMPLTNEGVTFLQFFLFGLSFSIYLKNKAIKNYMLKGGLYACLIGILLESAQMIVSSRMPDAQDVLVIILGSTMGAFFLELNLANIPASIWSIAIILATGVAVGIQTLSPFKIKPDFTTFNWFPFRPYYERTTFVALSNFIESLFSYFPMGFVLQFLHRKEKSFWLNIALITCTLSFIFELMQAKIVGRYPDITDVLGALIGAILGAKVYLDGWAVFKKWLRHH